MIELEYHDGIACVRLAHGPVNALDLELLTALGEAVASTHDAAALILTGSGRAFSAGVDLRRIVDGGPAYVDSFLPALDTAVLSLFEHPRPVVAAINGHAIAGGCILAQACDLRLISRGTIGTPELFVGVPFPTVALEVLRHALGPAVTRVVLAQAPVAAEEAPSIGLVDEFVEPDSLQATALERAATLGEIERSIFALTKRQLRGGAMRRIEELRPAADPLVLEAWRSPETAATISGYLTRLSERAR